MGCMLDSDWSRQFLLRCDWLVLSVASYTTYVLCFQHVFTIGIILSATERHSSALEIKSLMVDYNSTLIITEI